MQLYLNEGFEGGATTFLHDTDPVQHYQCHPRTGMVLIFEHKILHEGSPMVKGRKYLGTFGIAYVLLIFLFNKFRKIFKVGLFKF